MTEPGVVVQRFPGQPPLAGDALRAFALVDQLVAPEKLGIEPFEALILLPERNIQEHRRPGHAFHAAADHVVHVACRHCLGGEVHGLLGRAAHSVERNAGHLHRQPEQEHGQPRWIRALLSRQRHRPVDHILDPARVDARAPDQVVDGMRQQAVRPLLPQRPASPAERRAHRFNNDRFIHGKSSTRRV